MPRIRPTKTSQQHTPGPWKAANGSIYAQWAIPGEWHGLPATEANLRLQAAAPDLLAALEDFVGLALCADADGGTLESGFPQHFADARAAIAKARGA